MSLVALVIVFAVLAAVATLLGLFAWKLATGVRTNKVQHALIVSTVNDSIAGASKAADSESALESSVSQEQTYINQQLKAVSDQVAALKAKVGGLHTAAQKQASAKAASFNLAADSVAAKAGDIAPDYAAVQQQAADLTRGVDQLQRQLQQLATDSNRLDSATRARLQNTQLVLASVQTAMAGMDDLDAPPDQLKIITDALAKLDRTQFDAQVLPVYASRDDLYALDDAQTGMVTATQGNLAPVSDSVQLITDVGAKASASCPSAAQGVADLQAQLTSAGGDVIIPQGQLCLQDACITAEDITRARAALAASTTSAAK